jgi:hypothetical protein
MVLALVVAASEAQVGIDYEVQRAVEYGQHDGVKLTGDLYTPKAAGNYYTKAIGVELIRN